MTERNGFVNNIETLMLSFKPDLKLQENSFIYEIPRIPIECITTSIMTEPDLIARKKMLHAGTTSY